MQTSVHRRRAFATYPNECAHCGHTGSDANRLEVHHKERRTTGFNDPDNLVILCHDCHIRLPKVINGRVVASTDKTLAKSRTVSDAARERGKQIKALRERLGMTQAALAYQLTVSVDAVRKWEQGQRTPGAYNQALLDALSASQGDIYRDPESAPDTSYGSCSTEQPTPDELDTDEVEDAA